MSDTGWELRFRHDDEESARTEQQSYQHNAMTNDTGVRPRAVRLLEYLEAVRSLRERPVRDVVVLRNKIPDRTASGEATTS